MIVKPKITRRPARLATTIKDFVCASADTRVLGWRALILENNLLKVTILPEYGGLIFSIFHKPRAIEMLWRSPRGLLAKDDPPVVPESSLGFRATSPGCWPELFPHGSGPTDVCGVRMPFHGEVVNRVWRYELLPAHAGEAAIRMWVDCHLLPLRLERIVRLRVGHAALILDETVVNRAGIPIDFMWGHHPYFGKPLMDADSRIIAPATHALDSDLKPMFWPVHAGHDFSVCPAEGSGVGAMFYLTDFPEGWYALVNPALKLGLAMAWDPAVFPYVWIWQEANKSMGYPYFGGAHAVAIEPFSSLPAARQRGDHMLRLTGGETMSTRLAFAAFDGLTNVTAVSRDGHITGS